MCLNSKKVRLVVIGFVAVMVMGGISAKADFTFGEPVNLGQQVNSSSYDGRACMSADGLELYITSDRMGSNGNCDVWVLTRQTTKDEWSPPENLGPAINSASACEHHPTISADGLELYFEVWERDSSGSYTSGSIWVTTRSSNSDPWGQRTKLEMDFPDDYLVASPSLTADGLELYFNAGLFKDVPQSDLYVLKRETIDASWGAPINLGPIVNISSCQVNPTISADGLVLLFSDWWNYSPRPDGLGCDIWISRRATRDSDWEPPVVLDSSINTNFYEDSTFILADGSMLYFSTNRYGGQGSMDLWQAPILPVVDFDDDGSVGMNDLLTMIGVWGTNERLCDIGPMPWGDGVVDEADLEILMEHWGEFYPTIVDNFESYTNEVDMETGEGPAIWNTWIDGFFTGTSGAIVGYSEPPFAETRIVHNGYQAMPFFYDNDGTLFEGDEEWEVTGVPYYSETQRTWAEPQDWTRRGVEVLTLWFYGDPGNAIEPFYVGLEDSAGSRKDITHPHPVVLTVNDWQQWRIPLTDFNNVDPTAIKIMYIGTGNPASTKPGGSGLVRIDDIELHRSGGQ